MWLCDMEIDVGSHEGVKWKNILYINELLVIFPRLRIWIVGIGRYVRDFP